jgi:hypothetical protein
MRFLLALLPLALAHAGHDHDHDDEAETPSDVVVLNEKSFDAYVKSNPLTVLVSN